MAYVEEREMLFRVSEHDSSHVFSAKERIPHVVTSKMISVRGVKFRWNWFRGRVPQTTHCRSVNIVWRGETNQLNSVDKEKTSEARKVFIAVCVVFHSFTNREETLHLHVNVAKRTLHFSAKSESNDLNFFRRIKSSWMCFAQHKSESF